MFFMKRTKRPYGTFHQLRADSQLNRRLKLLPWGKNKTRTSCPPTDDSVLPRTLTWGLSGKILGREVRSRDSTSSNDSSLMRLDGRGVKKWRHNTSTPRRNHMHRRWLGRRAHTTSNPCAEEPSRWCRWTETHDCQNLHVSKSFPIRL